MVQFALVYNETHKFCLALLCHLHKSTLSYTQLHHFYQKGFYPIIIEAASHNSPG